MVESIFKVIEFTWHFNDTIGASDIDCHIFPDPSSSSSDPSQIGQTGTTNTLLRLAVLEWSNGWRELMYSRS